MRHWREAAAREPPAILARCGKNSRARPLPPPASPRGLVVAGGGADEAQDRAADGEAPGASARSDPC